MDEQKIALEENNAVEVTKAVPLNETEKSLILKWKDKRAETNTAANFEVNEGKIDVKIKGSRGSDYDRNSLLSASLSEITGAVNPVFAISLIEDYANIENRGSNPEKFALAANHFIDTMSSLKPQDEVEGMLFTQILTLQSLGMKCMVRASNPEASTVNVDRNVNNLTKLLKLQHEAIESLNRYRRKGAQQVVVQHVSVNQGGQAIVGSVNHSAPGDGLKNRGSTP